MPERLEVWHCCRFWQTVTIIWLVASGAVSAQESETAVSPMSLFEQMAEATRARNYDGVFVYSRGEHANSMRIIHRADINGEQERIVSLSGPAREVIRNNQTVTCIFPESRSVMVEKSAARKFLPTLNQPASELAKNYQFALLGRDRVAGRRAWVIGVLPRTAYRYGYRFWIDAENRLLLRSEVVNSRGTALEQILFTQIAVPESISDELLKPGIEGSSFTRYERNTTNTEPESSTAPVEKWKVQWVPDGFSLRGYKVQRLSASDNPVEHIVYSDGLATVSVFVEPLGAGSDSLQGFSAMGAVNTFSTVSNNFQVTVVGEVPPLTVRQIAGSVVPASSSQQ